MNVLVIMTDSFRPDHVGAYGSQVCRTPCLDAFAQRATVFDRAYEATFPTVPTRADMFAGKAVYPELGWGPLPREWPVLAQVLSDHGYLTQMIIDTPHIIAHGFYYQRGFHSYHWVRGQETDVIHLDPPADQVPLPAAEETLRNPARMREGHYRTRTRWELERDRFAPRTMSLAMDWLERNRQRSPFFLYVDTFDPHEPWDAPAWYLDLYADPEFRGNRADYPLYRHADRFLTAAETRHLDAMYSAEATMVDHWLGRLLDTVDRLGLADDTAVVVMSDHGFYLGDHGLVGKLNMFPDEGGPYPMYDALVKTVLMTRLPGQTASRRTAALAQPCDLAPTLLDLLGLEPPPAFTASSLAAVVRGDSDIAPDREVAVTTGNLTRGKSWNVYTAITDGEWTLNVCPGRPSLLHHTAADPAQENDLIAEHGIEAARLFEAYLRRAAKDGVDASVLGNIRDGVRL